MMRRNKYNRKIYIDTDNNEKYDSKLEYDYAEYLKSKGIQYTRQQKYILQDSYYNGCCKKIRPIYYIADFVYFDETGKCHIVDCKGIQTDVYKIKKKLFEYRYRPMVIEEIHRGDFNAD